MLMCPRFRIRSPSMHSVHLQALKACWTENIRCYWWIILFQVGDYQRNKYSDRWGEADNSSHRVFWHCEWFFRKGSIAMNHSVLAGYYWEEDVSARASKKVYFWNFIRSQSINTQVPHDWSSRRKCDQVWCNQNLETYPFKHFNKIIRRCFRLPSERWRSTLKVSMKALNTSREEEVSIFLKYHIDAEAKLFQEGAHINAGMASLADVDVLVHLNHDVRNFLIYYTLETIQYKLGWNGVKLVPSHLYDYSSEVWVRSRCYECTTRTFVRCRLLHVQIQCVSEFQTKCFFANTTFKQLKGKELIFVLVEEDSEEFWFVQVDPNFTLQLINITVWRNGTHWFGIFT